MKPLLLQTSSTASINIRNIPPFTDILFPIYLCMYLSLSLSLSLARSYHVNRFYVYDSYLTPYANWGKILKPEGKNSIRGTKYDASVIALVVEAKDLQEIPKGGFDGVYTYFATG